MESSKERFEALLAALGVPLMAYTPKMGLDLLLRFHAENPVRGSLTWTSGFIIPTASGEEFGFVLAYDLQDLDDEELKPESFCLWFLLGMDLPRSNLSQQVECSSAGDSEAFRATIDQDFAWKLLSELNVAGVAITESTECPPVRWACMTEAEWLSSDDVALMQNSLRHSWTGEKQALHNLIQRYWLACSRKIWKLLVLDESRTGVELAQLYLDGLATKEETRSISYYGEAAAFMFDYDYDPEAIAGWVDEVSKLTIEELRAMLPALRPDDDLSPRKLLREAAFFAFLSMANPGSLSIDYVRKYRLFLPAPLLREMVGSPFDAAKAQ